MRVTYVLAFLALATGFSTAAPDPKSLRELHTLIKPKTSEQSWESIPWMTSLWAARERAAAQGKPILLWEMDGHPLGCT